jgi:hypothetical protein
LELTNIVRMVLQDNLCVALLPYDLMFQMSKILAIDTAEEQVSARELSLRVRTLNGLGHQMDFYIVALYG